MNPEEKFARDTVSKTLTFADGHYSVGMHALDERQTFVT